MFMEDIQYCSVPFKEEDNLAMLISKLMLTKHSQHSLTQFHITIIKTPIAVQTHADGGVDWAIWSICCPTNYDCAQNRCPLSSWGLFKRFLKWLHTQFFYYFLFTILQLNLITISMEQNPDLPLQGENNSGKLLRQAYHINTTQPNLYSQFQPQSSNPLRLA